MSAVYLTLPLPPSNNRLWRRSGTTIHKSTRYTAWLKEAGWMAKSQRPGSVSGPYKIRIEAARPDKRRRDLGNLEKAVSDLLQDLGVIRDDADCEMISMRWVTSGQGIAVSVEPAGVENV